MKPLDADTALALVRAKATEWQANADRTRTAGTVGADKSLGWHIDCMGERDGIAMELVEAWKILDDVMTRSHGFTRPEAWCVPQLTDEQFARAFTDWPELAVFGEDVLKGLCRHYGIRYVRWLARRAVKNTAGVPVAAPRHRPTPGGEQMSTDPEEETRTFNTIVLEALAAAGIPAYFDEDEGILIAHPTDVPQDQAKSGDHVLATRRRDGTAGSAAYPYRPRRAGGPVRAARARLARTHSTALRSRYPHLRTMALRGEWRHSAQEAAIRKFGVGGASAWRSGAYGHPVPRPPVDRSALPRDERTGTARRVGRPGRP
ncbi:hypothetical protein AB0H73_33785 [Streptomyces olivoreticuli]